MLPFSAPGCRLSSWPLSQRTARAISLFIDIGEGAGLSGASGVRPFLPALLAGALARGNSGIDFSGTDYSFLESVPFLVVVLVLAIGSYALESGGRKAGGGGRDPVRLGTGALGLVLGALLFAGTLADHHHKNSWLGLIAGVACAALGWFALAALFGRARRRLAGSGGGGAIALLDAYADAIALVLAAIAIVVPVVAYAALVAFVVLILRTRGEGARKFEGLRILR